ncbi:MAG: ABC transporter ATP-binding protein [Clostridia bacterium]|nr:ABC transporter ATP-binding protein [Clostridia bacterium]
MAVNKYDQDEELNVRVDFSYFSMLKKYLKPHIPVIIFTVLMMFVSAFCELLPPYFISLVLDKCLPESNFKLFFILVAALAVVAVLVCIIMRVRSVVTNRMAMRIIQDIRSDLFAHMQKLPFSFFDSRPHGKILVRVVNYVNSIANLFANGIIDMITNVFKMFVIIGFMFAMDVKFTLISLAGFPLFAIVLTIIRSRHMKAWRKLSAKQSNLNAYLQESINGMKITQSFAREEKNAEIFDNLCEDNKKFWMKAVYISLGIPMFVSVLSTTTTAAVYVMGVGRIAAGVLQVGTLIAFASYVSRFWEPVTALTTFYNEIVNVGSYIERIFQMLDEPLVVEDLPGAQPLENIKGDVKFENVTFAYERGARNILENVSFEVKSGDRIALVGPTGAGKSTVINLLARFYDIQGGKITIDGNDITHATLNSLRSQMGIMLQDSFLFSGTIMDNIRYSRLDATDEQVIEAAKAVCAHDFIMQFPKGYETEVNEGGTSLSAGQKQLIAFARALLADPAILILDEATSSIDTETEIALQKGLERLLQGRTSFIIAHRLSTIKNSTKIMYIADKNIAESGTHDELITKGGRYYELYMAQYKFLENM